MSVRRLLAFCALTLALAPAAVSSGVLSPQALAAPTQVGRPAASKHALDRALLAEMNAVRVAHGLAPLHASRALAAAARAHSLEMARLGFFQHESADGGAFWRRVKRFYGAGGYRFWGVGENLLWSSPDIDAKGAVEDWLRSHEHRVILLSPRWHELGVASVHSTAAPGEFGEREVTIVTADFGVRTR